MFVHEPTTGMSILELVVVAFWLMLPAYVPNNAAVLFGGGRPIDDGKTWRGKRILGDGKTWRGTIAGTAVGAVLALVLTVLAADLSTLTGIDLPEFSLVATLTLPFGALLGDMTASFIKRRSGRERGAPFPGLDQLDFVVMALALTAAVDFAVTGLAWMGEQFTLPVLVVIFVMTPILHVVTNVGAYKLGLKDEPW